MQRCSVLMKLDYSIIEISNSTGELSSHYPSQILIPEFENARSNNSNSVSNNSNGSSNHSNNHTISSNNTNVNINTTNHNNCSTNCNNEDITNNGVESDNISMMTTTTITTTPTGITEGNNIQQQTIYESANDPTRLRDLINKARFARCRARFPLPVILYKGKYICRSATLSGGPEIYGRSGLDYFFYGVDTTATTTPTNTASTQQQKSEVNNKIQQQIDNNCSNNTKGDSIFCSLKCFFS